jgi:AcrR family transcriptional regulator
MLFAAAIKLVTERETTAITVSELADAADVSRRVVYQQFKDKDSLLLEAGLDFARRARQGAARASGNRQHIRRRYGNELDPAVEQDLADYLTGGTAAIVHSCVVSAPDPLDPEVLVDRLGRLLPLILGPGPASGRPEEGGRASLA